MNAPSAALAGEVYLARHGETRWNRDGRMQGRSDAPLTPLGWEQARRLAAFARTCGVSRILASPLGRCQATARIVAEATGALVETRAELVEMDFGLCSGGTVAQAEARFPELLEQRRRDKWHARWPGGESYADVVARLHSLVQDLAAEATTAGGELAPALARTLAPAPARVPAPALALAPVPALAFAPAPALAFAPTLVLAHQSVNRVLSCLLSTRSRMEALASSQPADLVLRIAPDRSIEEIRTDGSADAPRPARAPSISTSARSSEPARAWKRTLI
ncbi:MAG: histidine phosphatase family protein [Candidatus Eisenbacteria bacterium]